MSAGILSAIVVAIFAVAKFTEGAWLVVVVFPLLVFILIRLNREYRAEAAILEEFRSNRPEQVNYARHTAFRAGQLRRPRVLEALRYGHGLRADDLTAVHLVVDAAQARKLRERWEHYGLTTPLKIIDCPDRRITRGVQRLVVEALSAAPRSHVTVLLPRRTYAPLLGRLLHDRSADKISRAISEIPHAAATIIPFDVQAEIRKAFPDLMEERLARRVESLQARLAEETDRDIADHDAPESSSSVLAISGLIPGIGGPSRARVRDTFDRVVDDDEVHIVEISDDSGLIAVAVHRARRKQRQRPRPRPARPRGRERPVRGARAPSSSTRPTRSSVRTTGRDPPPPTVPHPHPPTTDPPGPGRTRRPCRNSPPSVPKLPAGCADPSGVGPTGGVGITVGDGTLAAAAADDRRRPARERPRAVARPRQERDVDAAPPSQPRNPDSRIGPDSSSAWYLAM